MGNAVILFWDMKTDTRVDLEVPLSITADEFVHAMNQTYHLGMDSDNSAYLQMEHPIALLKGDETLEKLGMRMGSIVLFKG